MYVSKLVKNDMHNIYIYIYRILDRDKGHEHESLNH